MTSEERASQLELARGIALNQLAARARSAAELRRALAKRNVAADVIDELLGRFAEVGLIDDAAFAEALTQSRALHSGRGRARIRRELQEKGVASELVQQALEGLDPDDERAAALALAMRRARSLAGFEPHVARRRLMGVLLRRGYPAPVVASVADEVLGQLAEAGMDAPEDC